MLEDLLAHPKKWLRRDMVLSAPFLQLKPSLTPAGSQVPAHPSRIDEKFREAWLPFFCRSGRV